MEGEAKEMMQEKISLRYVYTALIIAGVVFIAMAGRKPVSDFGNYYYGARNAMGKSGVSVVQVYDVLSFNSAVENSGERNFFLNHCTVTPQSVLIYRCISWIGSANIARMLFNLAGLVFFMVSLRRFFQHFSVQVNWQLLVVLGAALLPVYSNIVAGQTYLFIASFVMEAILFADERPWLSGLLLGLAITLKISPAIILIWFLSEKKYKVIAWTAGTVLLFAVATLWTVPYMAAPFMDFYEHSLPRMMNGFISDPFSSSFQGMIVFLRKTLLHDAVLNPGGAQAGERMVQLLNIVFILIVAVFITGAWKRGLDLRRKIVLLLLFVCATSGYTSTYSLLLLVPFVVTENENRSWIRVLLYAIILAAPPRLFDGTVPVLETYKLWIFIALLWLETRSTFSFRTIEKKQLVIGLVFLLLLCTRFAQRPEELKLVYYRPEQVQHDYVLGAFVAQEQVRYVTYTPEGFQSFTVPFAGGEPSCAGNCEPFYYHHVKMKAIGQTKDSLLMLSDYHRGPGLMHLYMLSKQDYNFMTGASQ